jgi:phosphonate transport system substrate-binding protein
MMTLKLRWYSLVLLLLALTFATALNAAELASKQPIRIGLTPVFLEYQGAFINEWRLYLESRLGKPVIFVQRGNYREIINMLHNERLDFAWVSGYPFVRNKGDLRLVAVPLYHGEPLHQSYLIVPNSDHQTRSLGDLRKKIFAFSDPDSNSGYLYVVHLLSEQGDTPLSYFGKSFFTWSHLKVVEAVASGLAQGGAVDGYVWDTLALAHPELTSRTRILKKSPQFGHPPFVANRAVSKKQIVALQQALFRMSHDKEGLRLLKTLNLDGFTYSNARLYDTIDIMTRTTNIQPHP